MERNINLVSVYVLTAYDILTLGCTLTAQLSSPKEDTMDTQVVRMPQIRRENKNFVIEENVDAVKWPQECANCGGPAEEIDSLRMSKEFKGIGKIKVEVKGIPYCRVCFPKIRAGKLLDQIHLAVTFLIGIPLGILLIALMMTSENVQFICCGLVFLVALLIGYGLAWLLVKLPAKILFGKKIAEPVGGRLIEEKKKDGKEGISVVLTIPREDFALKFAELNKVRA